MRSATLPLAEAWLQTKCCKGKGAGKRGGEEGKGKGKGKYEPLHCPDDVWEKKWEQMEKDRKFPGNEFLDETGRKASYYPYSFVFRTVVDWDKES